MYTLNLIPKKTTPVIVSCSEGDQIFRAFQFKIMDGESNWSIDCDSLSMEISNGVQFTAVGNKIGFFGTAAIEKVNGITTSSTLSTLISALKKYGLV